MVRCQSNSKERIEEHHVFTFLQDLGESSKTQKRILNLLGSNYYFCSRHAKSSKKAIADLRDKMSRKSRKVKDIEAAIDGWIQVLCGSKSAVSLLGSVEVKAEFTPELKPELKPQVKPATARLTTWQPKITEGLTVAKALEKKIKKPLSKSDEQNSPTGYIYIFWKAGQFGKVKIGRTKNLDVRLKGWQKCDPSHTYHKTTSEEGDPIMVPHVHRVEALIHIELKEFRRKQKCNVCKGAPEHDEWFEVDVEHAKRVLQKWQSWILQEPYAPDGKWTIHPEMVDTVQEVCQPVPIPKKKSLKKMPPKIASPRRKVSHRRRTI
jgi:hypothetical protein